MRNTLLGLGLALAFVSTTALAGIRDEPIPLDLLHGPGQAPTVQYTTDATGIPRLERIDATTLRLVNSDGNLDFAAHVSPTATGFIATVKSINDDLDPVGLLVDVGGQTNTLEISDGETAVIGAFDSIEFDL